MANRSGNGNAVQHMHMADKQLVPLHSLYLSRFCKAFVLQEPELRAQGNLILTAFIFNSVRFSNDQSKIAASQ